MDDKNNNDRDFDVLSLIIATSCVLKKRENEKIQNKRQICMYGFAGLFGEEKPHATKNLTTLYKKETIKGHISEEHFSIKLLVC